MADRESLTVLIVGIGEQKITFLDRLINGLTKKGVHVIFSSPRRPKKERFDPNYVEWLWTPSWKVARIKRIINVIGLIIELPGGRQKWLVRAIKSKKTPRDKWLEFYQLSPFSHVTADVIYFPWNSSAITFRSLYDLEIPFIVSCRGSQVNIHPHLPDNNLYHQALAESFNRAAAVHCVSQDILEEAKQYGLDPTKTTVIRPAVNPEFFTPNEKSKHNNHFSIITTGSLIWTKGYEYALLAIRYLVNWGVNLEFHIIGDGKDKQRILYTIQDLKLEKHVVLHGKVPPNEVRDGLQQSDSFILSSLSEGISNAVLEAMSCGLPIVTCDCGGMREAITDGVEGFIVPVRDPLAMAEKMKLLADDPELRLKMGIAGRERILQQFNEDRLHSDFISLVYKAANGNENRI